MSGGQKRAAALATVLSMRVKLLLLDEPGANLDNRSRRRLIEILDGRSEAMLLATHDLPLVRRLCSACPPDGPGANRRRPLLSRFAG